MGRLRKRGGIWHADYYDRVGRRQRESTRTGDHAVARARLRELELATTDHAPHATETLDAALIYYLTVACAQKPTSTTSSYTQKSRHLSRLIGATDLGELTLEAVERYIAARLTEGAHPHSVHKELVVLRGALTSAKARKRFPGDLSVVPRFKASYTPRRAYQSPDQFVRMIEALVPPMPARARPRTLADREARLADRARYCMLIAFASPRAGELEALQDTDVDLARGVIQIPKGKTVARPIAIHPALRPWLEDLEPGALVRRWSNVRRDLPRACERAGVPRVTPNDLRRTFASWLVQGGASLLVVSRLLGHKSTRMVDLVYGQLDEATLLGAMRFMPGNDCDAGVPRTAPTPGAHGAGGTSARPLTIVNSVEESFVSPTSVVPRDGIEPPTRGFSVLVAMAPKRNAQQRKLRAV